MRTRDLLAALEQPPLMIHNEEALNLESEIAGLAYDSRQVEVGGLFLAIPGTHTDGRLYLDDARQRGALIALGAPLEDGQQAPLPYIEVEDVRIAHANLACAFYGNPTRQLCTIGITGTDGKTTTSNLIHLLLEAGGKHSGLMTTANFKIGQREWENRSRQSTQEALDVQRMLRQMLNEGVTHAVIETTSHALELRRVYGCEFDVGVITNITREHLDFHQTIERYRRAKARLFEMLDPARDKGVGCRPVAVLNRDDASYEELRSYCRVPILDYGIDTPASIRAVDIRMNAYSTQFRLILPDAEGLIETPLVGRFNVSNCLAAIAVAYSQGIGLDKITSALATVQSVAGRMERVDEGQSFAVIVDYAHTPDSLEKILATLRPLTERKLIVIFGSAGERDVQKRPVMGRIAAQMSDFFVITDEDPREEDREKILNEIAAGAEGSGKERGSDFLCIADRREAIKTAFARAQPGDTVLLAGKGHEQSIIMGREKLPWDDRQAARELLKATV
ncbi:MAG: UDP-N-acetylmuramoyl-L-alanyl-D-glutamate--2,6-diaminopimelate ligase [Ktedonobacteraceae bacterium]|nr:UDP-N-acetylmuramoyl-L-alanyl-D-glutamate--2,6-diaminopimelate ligase [Ktedonobacteraceae bacterium]MBO0790914.1 UDP-N-acetylmuramoyl-L-alanyl-D-glutamate--2,6-diaminopimelate ligase [Ktedonobacteraceae bacterium]